MSLHEFRWVFSRVNTWLRLATWSKRVKVQTCPRFVTWSKLVKHARDLPLGQSLSNLLKTRQTHLKFVVIDFMDWKCQNYFFSQNFLYVEFFSICGVLSWVLLSCWVFLSPKLVELLPSLSLSSLVYVPKIKFWQVIAWLNQMKSWSLLKSLHVLIVVKLKKGWCNWFWGVR